MNITKNLLTKNQYSRTARNLIAIRGIVIHWIGNAGTSAKMNRNYFDSLKNQSEKTTRLRYASAHFIIDLDGSVIQCLPINEMAYHVGAKKYKGCIQKKLSAYPNNCTIGIEMCHPDWSGQFTDETYQTAVELAATLLKQYNLNPQKDLYRHYDITGKRCPKFFTDNYAAWLQFKSDVEKYLIGIL